MGIFERYLSVWVALPITAGVTLGVIYPPVFEAVAKLEFAHVNLVVAVFIWVMIYPMMVQIGYSTIKKVGKKPKGLVIGILMYELGYDKEDIINQVQKIRPKALSHPVQLSFFNKFQKVGA